MSNFNIIKETKLSNSFRVKATIDKFTMEAEKFRHEFKGEIDISGDWNIGCTVGSSGTGKTTIARELFGADFIESFDYKSKSILDDMPKECSLDDIHMTFTSVGFASPPDWVKPYHVLSNGQKMRVDLARSLLENRDIVAFDEFTSVINREVAQTGSLAIQKAVRKKKKKFVAVAVHRDILDWLQPDWVFDTDTFEYHKKKTTFGTDQILNWKYLKLQRSIGNSFGNHCQNIII